MGLSPLAQPGQDSPSVLHTPLLSDSGYLIPKFPCYNLSLLGAFAWVNFCASLRLPHWDKKLLLRTSQ